MTSQMKGDENKLSKDSVVPQSYKGMTLEEARVFLRSIMDLFQSLASMSDLKTMYEAGKQLSRLYFDCASHQRELAEILLELEFPEYAIKTMKKLNNMGVFKNDDIWFSSFYFYNICWNYSDASFEFATALGLCGLPNLLNLNIGHKPYLDNLSSRNVYYLIKASLSIIHNICRYPGSCTYFRSESVRSSLINLIEREEDFIRVVASLCLASVVSENDSLCLAGGEDRPGVMVNIVNYVRKARQSERGRFMGFRSHELMQGLRAATTVEGERRHLVEVEGGLALVKEGLCGRTVVDEDTAECLETVSNVAASADLRPRLLEAGITADLIRSVMANAGDNVRVRAAAEDCLWSLDQSFDQVDLGLDQGLMDTINDGDRPLPIFICYAAINRFSVLKIRDRLTDTGLVTFVDPEDRTNADSVRRAIRKCALVIVCVSEALKSEPRHQLQVEYCERLARPVIPLLIQQKYRPDGWTQRLLERDNLQVFDLSSKRDFEAAWETFVSSLSVQLKDIRTKRQVEVRRVKQEKINDEVDHVDKGGHRSNCVDDSMSRSQHEPIPTQMDVGYRRFNGGAENNVDEGRSRSMGPVDLATGGGDNTPLSTKENNNSSSTNITTGGWLDRHELGHLKSQLAYLDMTLLKYYQDMKTQAPEYFYQTLDKHLKLDFVDILKFSNAIDHL